MKSKLAVRLPHSRFSRVVSTLLMSWMLPLAAQAVPVEGLYSASVSGQLEGAPTDQQLYQGLAQVLIKVSGRRDIMERPESRALVDNAPLLLQRSEAGADAAELYFAPEQLSGLMQSLGLPLVGNDRPALLLWIVQRSRDGSVDYLPAGAELYDHLRAAAARRGLPLMLPLYDLDDQLALSAEELMAGAEASVIQQASQRYQPAAVLVGAVDRSAAEPLAQWSFWMGPERVDYTIAGQAELTAMVDQLADRLLAGEPTAAGTTAPGVAANGAANGAAGDSSWLPATPVEVGEFAPQGIALSVEGVQGTADYIELMRWLNAQPGVGSVTTAGFDAGRLQLRVLMDDGGAVLPPLPTSGEGLVALGAGRYRWSAPAAVAPQAPETGAREPLAE